MPQSVLVCPVCGGALLLEQRRLVCSAGHSFDMAKEGYVNLLCTSKAADKMGDSKESAAARHAFLERGYYGCLKEALTPYLQGNVLDICCGEGYYDSVPADGALYGFDLSKTMVRLAAKRKNGGMYFVANLARIPVAPGSIDTALHLFAPFHDRSFHRVLAPGGRLYSVTPGARHLWQIKETVYDRPYANREGVTESPLLEVQRQFRVAQTVTIPAPDLQTLFAMTPYYYRTAPALRARLDAVEQLPVTLDFLVTVYKKRDLSTCQGAGILVK